MLTLLIDVLEWLFNFLKHSDARMLGRTEAELSNANKVLQEVSDAKKIDEDIANTPIDTLKLRYGRFKADK